MVSTTMPNDEPNPVKEWTGLILFFGVGVAIGLPTALMYITDGVSYGFAIALGAFLGGYGAWLIFFLSHHIIAFIRRLFHSNESE
jgi:hypothetical protein